jgi:hypothetical protein
MRKSSQMVFQGEACCFHIEERFFHQCWLSKVAVMTAVDVTDPLRQENKKNYVNCASVEKVAQTTLGCPSVFALPSTGLGRLSHLP